MEIFVNKKKVLLNPQKSIGKGQEADVYNIGGGKALKVFKPPNHPDYINLPDKLQAKNEQEGAKNRIAEHQKKLPSFPANLPPKVITPIDLATNKIGNKILGYTMNLLDNAKPLFQYSDINFRRAGIGNEVIKDIFLDLYNTVTGLHKRGVIIGDFNDLNVLIKNKEAFLIDSDSFQFSKFLCRMFTARFVDPILCDPKRKTLMLFKPYKKESDWYAFAVMLMQNLLFVDPYGGIYKPKDKANRLKHNERPLYRITVFHPEVKYPKPAIPYKVLSDDLLHYFDQVFTKDKRGIFPENLLLDMHWVKCASCGLEHARHICPDCVQATPGIVREVIKVQGKVTATHVFKTRGVILFAAYQDNNLAWLYHEDGEFRREKGLHVVAGDLNPHIRYRLYGKATLMGKNGQVAILSPTKAPGKIAVDSFGALPIFDSNGNNYYWLYNSQLLRNGAFGPEYIGDVLGGQTLFWAGKKFGFGFYRAGDIQVAFVFDALKRGINDNVKLPFFRGQLVDSTCFFSDNRCWFLAAVREGGKTVHYCFIIRPDGLIEAKAEAELGDGSWLGTLRGKCAAGNFLLATTDEGIVRAEPNYGRIEKAKEFPDTEPFVDTSCHLFPGNEGLYVVGKREISLLKIS